MTPEFNAWWDAESDIADNPYLEGSPAFWAWEGWQAGVKAEREACAKMAQERGILGLAATIRARNSNV